MKFCQVVPEICRGQVHGPRKERRKRKRKRRIIIIIIRNGAKTISIPNFVWETELHYLRTANFEKLFIASLHY
jgi:hypothetical protein